MPTAQANRNRRVCIVIVSFVLAQAAWGVVSTLRDDLFYLVYLLLSLLNLKNERFNLHLPSRTDPTLCTV